MTINSNSMMASQMYANRNVQAQSGASGYASQGTDATLSFDAIAQQLMSTLDTNKNGTIDKTEFSQAAQALAQNSTANTNNVDSAFGKLDKNGDSSISADELMNALKQTLNETQKKHHHQASTTNTTSPATSSNESATSASTNDMQKVLFNKIMAAYSSTPTVSGSTTNLTA
ncbi:MAG: EF-hand domain-containing protein [Sulfuricurvum sp.]|uniref:EF-hand domain-containing protein n=1 Tax=Sulfuricurvum sp. TaxID=2025608 RepID=UPI00260BBA97|nr:EF-hand domain-containing protein [Sulfuricurvum sp.]MDD2828466.1 EF-hand domain-containing protein [Sulfuricurvum sp.]MDD4949003.1 EF-hand domain-containing protein [Sulfuricurvum sp.]